MYRLFVLRNDKSDCVGGHALISLWALLLCFGNGALAQSTAPTVKRERAIQHSGYSSSGFAKHKEQLQRNVVNSRQCVAISARWQARRRGKHRFCPGEFFWVRKSKQVGGVPMKIGKDSRSVRRWPSR